MLQHLTPLKIINTKSGDLKIKLINQFMYKNFFFQSFPRSFCLGIILVLLTFGLFHSENIQAQNAGISVSLKNKPLELAIRAVEKQSDFTFVYDSHVVDVKKKVTVSVRSADISNVLNKIFAGTGISYKVLNNKIILSKKSAMSGKPKFVKIKGRVTDEKGVPVIGATVMIPGTQNGVITDVEGNYEISNVSSETSDISFSSLGYVAQVVPISGRSTINFIVKEDKQMLEEVVVVGYGTQKKLSVTGAISQVDNKQLKMAPSGSLSSMLGGRLPGLITKQSSGQPGKDNSSLVIRGAGAGDGSALIVVDGVVVEYFPTLSPDEVESITILKDATAAAVYGVRASGGVVLVTTKRGKLQKPTVTVNSAVTLSQNANFPEFLNGPDYAYWYNEAQRLDGIPEENLRFTADEIKRITNPSEDETVYGNTDWFDLLFNDVAPSYTNNVSVSGGTEKIRFFGSLGAYNQRGVISRTSFDKYSFRANFDTKITDHFDMSMNLSGFLSLDKEPGASAGSSSYAAIFPQAMMSYPYLRPYTEDGIPVGSLNMAGNGNNNPIAARDLSGQTKVNTSSFQGNISLSYKVPFIQGLKLKLDASYLKNAFMKKSWLNDYELACWNQTTRTWTMMNGRIASKVTLAQWYRNSDDYQIRPSIEYHHKFGKHDISGLFLYEYNIDKYYGISTGKEDFPIKDIIDISYGETITDSMIQGSHGVDKRAGYVLRLNYAYADKYLFELTSRIDASTALPKANRWGVFPGVSLGWRISEEGFFKDALPFWDNLKLRASAGRLGSDSAISNTMAYFSVASLSQDPFVLFGNKPEKNLGVSGPVNMDLKWQLTDSYNFGIESSMWRGKLGIELDVFYMKTTRTLAGQSGTFRPSLGGWFPGVINYGSHDNRGFELSLSHVNHIGDFNYSISGNVSWARNKVLKTTEDPNVPDYLRRTGRPMGTYWGFEAEGLFQSEEEIEHSAVYGPTLPGDIKLKDINGDGKITYEQDRVPIGRSSFPEMMFGLTIAGDWRGIDFSMLFQGASLFDVDLCGIYPNLGFYDNTFYTQPFYCDGNSPYYLVENAWRPDHTDAEYPRLGVATRQNGGKMSSWWVKDGTYLRLKSFQLGYTIPEKWSQSIGLQKIRAYFAGGNLFTISGLKTLDPEMPSVNQGYYPQQRTYEFGLNISF